MSFSREIFSVWGIPVKVHISLWLLPALFMLAGQSFSQSVVFFIAIAASVVMHELAHALTAKHYGIPTKDITLYVFGGIARVKMTKYSAREEFFITIAGPLSNFVLAIAMAFFLDLSFSDPKHLTFLEYLFIMNMAMGIFNLVPAFPMDGGRVLRSGLKLLRIKKANFIVCVLSKIISVIFFVLALLYTLPGLFIISILLFIASDEALLDDSNSVDLNTAKVS